MKLIMMSNNLDLEQLLKLSGGEFEDKMMAKTLHTSPMRVMATRHSFIVNGCKRLMQYLKTHRVKFMFVIGNKS